MSNQQQRRRDGEHGFTMIELLVTLAVSLIGLAGMLSLHKAIAAGNGGSIRAAEAVKEAEGAMEDLRQSTFVEIQKAYGELPIEVDLGEVAGRNDQLYQRRLFVTSIDAAPEMFKTRIEVEWTDAGAVPGADNGAHDHRIELEVLRSQQEAL